MSTTDSQLEQSTTESHYDSNEEEYDDEEYDEEEEMEDEPKLRYRRVGASVKEIFEKDTASTIRVSDKFVVGTRYTLGCSSYS
ncbi:hypothetical protein RMATCC62417_08477 [Rhizopus microsporus]|nr:hypothetical protein RMATCC62417_08477 [Rhizopus microsporus]